MFLTEKESGTCSNKVEIKHKRKLESALGILLPNVMPKKLKLIEQDSALITQMYKHSLKLYNKIFSAANERQLRRVYEKDLVC